MDQKEKTSQEYRELRLALVAGGHREPEDMFPGFYPAAETTPESADAIDDPESAIDFSGVVYTPMTEEAYAEYERLLMEEPNEISSEEGEPDQDGEWI